MADGKWTLLGLNSLAVLASAIVVGTLPAVTSLDWIMAAMPVLFFSLTAFSREGTKPNARMYCTVLCGFFAATAVHDCGAVAIAVFAATFTIHGWTLGNYLDHRKCE